MMNEDDSATPADQRVYSDGQDDETPEQSKSFEDFAAREAADSLGITVEEFRKQCGLPPITEENPDFSAVIIPRRPPGYLTR
jgi:hypothetical protein